MKSNITPFGQSAQQSCLTTLKKNFSIGIHDYDRGHDVWDPNFVNEAGVVEPSWVHVPQVSRECVVLFATNTGQGTGRQFIPADEFDDYVSVLEGIIASGYQEPERNEREEYTPTNVIARRSFQLVRPRIHVMDDKSGKTKAVEDKSAERNVVSVRSKNGQGSKPILIPINEFPDVVNCLREVANNIQEYQAQAWAAFEAETKSEE